MNCHECQHARSIPGNAHTQCGHPKLAGGNGLMALMVVMQCGKFKPFGMTFSAHGIKNGWCNWPLVFDPIWVNSCNQFQAKAVIQHETKPSEP